MKSIIIMVVSVLISVAVTYGFTAILSMIFNFDLTWKAVAIVWAVCFIRKIFVVKFKKK